LIRLIKDKHLLAHVPQLNLQLVDMKVR